MKKNIIAALMTLSFAAAAQELPLPKFYSGETVTVSGAIKCKACGVLAKSGGCKPSFWYKLPSGKHEGRLNIVTLVGKSYLTEQFDLKHWPSGGPKTGNPIPFIPVKLTGEFGPLVGNAKVAPAVFKVQTVEKVNSVTWKIVKYRGASHPAHWVPEKTRLIFEELGIPYRWSTQDTRYQKRLKEIEAKNEDEKPK